MSHFDISGNVSNDEQPLNNSSNDKKLDVFHFDKSGKYCKEEHQ